MKYQSSLVLDPLRYSQPQGDWHTAGHQRANFIEILMKMENITFDNLPQAIALLLEKMEKLEQLLCGRVADTRTDQKPMGVKEAAAFLEVSIPTVYSKVCRGKLPAYKPGRKLYFDEAILIEHIKSAKKQANQATLEDIEHPAPELPRYRKRKAIRF